MNDDKLDETIPDSLLKAFHDDEEGLEILQVVLIIALAAIIFIVIRSYWNKTKEKSDDATDKALQDLQ